MNTERLLPHFSVTTVDGRRVRYAEEIWQRRDLLLIGLEAVPSAAWAAEVSARLAGAAEVIITTDPVEGLPRPGAIVADRWGEVHHVRAIDPAALDLDDLADWVRFVRMQCPECQGEAR